MRILAKAIAGVFETEVDNAIRPHGGWRTGKIPGIDVHIIELPPGVDHKTVVQALRYAKKFKFVEVDEQVEMAYVPNDSQYHNEWHLPKIGAPGAWDVAKGEAVVIAVCDTGVDASHPDLAGALEPGWNFYDGTADSSDVLGHGTAVAGVAAAVGDNGSGVAGVAFKARIMPLRVTDAQGYGYYSLFAQALTWAADRGARVANISFLGVTTSSTVVAAAQYFRSKGGVVVAAGGNSGGLRTDPVTDAIISVAATDSVDNRASFSSWGDYIDIAAPGVSVLTTMKGGTIAGFSGTSASSPVIAGAYALLISANPALAPAQLDEILLTNAVDLGDAGPDQLYGFGRVDVKAAMDEIRTPPPVDTEPPQVTIVSPTGGQVSGTFMVNVAASDNIGVTRVDLFVNGTMQASDTAAPYVFAVSTAGYRNKQKITLHATATDAAGNTGASSTVTVMVRVQKGRGKP